jgi:hypothetical protein
MQPWFIATKRFGPNDGERWASYFAWSGLTQLDEVVSLDPHLCPRLLTEIKDGYWPHIVNEDYLLDFFVDLPFLLAQISHVERANVLCVYRNPTVHPSAKVGPLRFELLGYDLVEVELGYSALTNCGGFPEAFSNHELSAKGLLTSLERAQEVQSALRQRYPEEPHAKCDVWAILRAASEATIGQQPPGSEMP